MNFNEFFLYTLADSQKKHNCFYDKNSKNLPVFLILYAFFLIKSKYPAENPLSAGKKM